jgi:hypothetical protein
MSEAFYEACVAPVIATEFPGLPHAAGLLGRGSEVLGYDHSMSTDHTWFARVIVFMADEVLMKQGELLGGQLTERIPELFEGFRPRSRSPLSSSTFSTSSVWM